MLPSFTHRFSFTVSPPHELNMSGKGTVVDDRQLTDLWPKRCQLRSHCFPDSVITKEQEEEKKWRGKKRMLDWEPTSSPRGSLLGQRLSPKTTEPPPAPLFEPSELTSWSFYRAGIAEFVATFLFLYISVLTVMGVVKEPTKCSTVGIQGIAWAFGGMIFALVYCTAGISGGHINPAVTFGLFLGRKLSLTRAIFYMVMQCLGAICGAGVVKGFMGKTRYGALGGGVNSVNHGYTKGDGLGAEIIGTFVLVYTVFSATDAKRSARDSHVPILAPLPIGFAVFLVHLATIPITGTGINPARSLGAAIIFNKDKGWDDHWIFWVGPMIGAALAALYHVVVIRAIPFKSK
ncbi:hypothetical protein V6N12_001288 [Hibiscus sabdariffa]|uniref:Uncharacterized protein n=1 Tax=Hibiscus sabdariffa TaxID=183260 RepID=A0ABR2C8E1_9ROSI